MRKEIIEKFTKEVKEKNVLIIGDVMIDKYLYGSVERQSPEAPVPILHHSNSIEMLGGAANVAANITGLGGQCTLLSVIGNDSDGQSFLKIAKTNIINTGFIYVSDSRKTTVKTRILDGSEHLLRVDFEDSHPLDEKEYENIISNIRIEISSGIFDAILIQDYNKGLLNKKLIREIINLAQERRIPISVDPKKENFKAYSGVYLFKPNLKELSEALGREVKPELEDLRAACNSLKENFVVNTIWVTLAEYGIFMHSEDHSFITKAVPLDHPDVCGAGDAVISVATLGMTTSLSLEELAKISNLVAGKVCSEIGVYAIRPNDLLDLFVL